MTYIHINNDYQITHDIIKETTERMTLKQIKDYAKSEIKSLIQNLDQQNMHILFNQRFRLQDEHEYFNDQEDFKSHDTVLFTDLMRLKHFPHKKGKWYNIDQIYELSDIIRRHPNDLPAIRKGLKIPSSSFQRLVKEWAAYNQNDYKTRRKACDQINLNETEQMYIAKLLKSPTYPWSVPQI